MREVVIVSASRTPVGSFNGMLSAIPTTQLGSVAIKDAIKKANINPENIDEVIMGNVLAAGEGQAPARQASLGAGVPNSVPCMTINKVCGSGLKAVMLASQSIMVGDSNIVVAGGMENMSLTPHLLEKSRTGYRMGNVQVVDSMVKDGLWDPYNDFHMGTAGEMCVKKEEFTREEQDNFAINSYKKSLNSIEKGYFKDEIAPVEIKDRKGTQVIDQDEQPFKSNLDKIPTLRPVFDKEGTITAANASPINDGASALVVMGDDTAKEMNIKPLVKILGYATHAQAPEWFTTAPVEAIKKALEKANLKIEDIDLFEINEAFAAVTMAAIKELSLDAEKVNVAGGAVAMGHALGSSGSRILTTLIHNLKRENKRYGLATLCIGGGEAVAMVVESV
ncbi:MAG: thiolase family protein [Sphingobacteriales bacterium]|nr:MAG: thiolase family protein [Sphingobacteriales bacterium]